MSEFLDEVPHTGGELTIQVRGGRYSLQYGHGNTNRMALVELIARDGSPVEVADLVGDLSSAPTPIDLRVMLPTDAEAMFGRSCPKCGGYFRTMHPFTTKCAYCTWQGSQFDFYTTAQRAFIRRQFDAILTALKGPDGETTVNFDAELAQLSRAKSTWVYSEEKQQNHFGCPACALDVDVLGEYVRCPGCGKRTARDVFNRKTAALIADFELDVASIPKDERHQRERRWRHYVAAAVGEFEALARDLASNLAALPCTVSRRKQITELNFQGIRWAATKVAEWFDIDLFVGIDQDGQTFLLRMFQRRHLLVHRGGAVDQDYIDKTGDTTVRLNQTIRVGSNEVRRLLSLVRTIGVNFLDGFDAITDSRDSG